MRYKRNMGSAPSALKCCLSLLTVLIVAGCAAQPPVPQDRFYRLQAVMAAAPLTTPALPGTLEVERFKADGITAGRPIVYVQDTDPNQLLEYHYHFWTQPPTVMLQDELATFLREAGIAERVVTPEMRLSPDHVLTARIRKLEQVVGQKFGSVIELEFGVRRIADNQLVFLKSYRHDATQNGSGVAAAVDALNESLNIVFSDLLADLKAL